VYGLYRTHQSAMGQEQFHVLVACNTTTYTINTAITRFK
jgi:hypothetical protein